MPTYDYRCTACGARFEAWQKFTDEPIRVCPTCSGPAQRVIHAPAITFKGSGFYITDSKGSSATPAASAASGDSGAGDSETAGAKTSEAPKAASESAASAPTSAEPAKAVPTPPAKAS